MILLGQNLQLFLGGKSVAFAKSHSVDISVDTVEVSTKDHGGVDAQEAGLLHWSITTENLLANSRSGLGFDELFDLMIAKEPIDLVFGVKDTVVDKNDVYEVPAANGWPVPTKSGYKGKALITSLSLSAPNGEASSMNATLTGVSVLEKINKTATMMMAAEVETATTTSKK